MKKIHLIILFLIASNCLSQIKSGKELAEKLKGRTFTIDRLVNYANINIKDDYEKAKFFYYWIGLNVNYDFELLNKMKTIDYNYEKDYSYNLSAESVFTKRQAICLGYSVLFKHFMDRADIYCYTIHGHIRDERNNYLDINKDSDFSHAWNVIEINDEWKIVDTTWGNSGNTDNLDISDYYFDIDPKRAIITHFPEKPEWQLLEKKVTLEEFNKSIYINAEWFKLGFEESPKVLQDDNYYYFTYKSNLKSIKANLKFSYDNVLFDNIPNSIFLIQDGIDYIKFEKKSIKINTFIKVNITIFDSDGSYLEYKDVINFKIK
ncbi:transglutaminase domain-containing protein [uncultured Flavobacterium sp.]|uniref:transglutaminase domain-containing protein n=1 Tax=uncultured Flavobacterium sp. TaxID=165435 RepID=UPI0030EF971F|tara:strand:+ start:5266 stop:6222 length:957 start_codon:yes stop_codon:yes gene_type:complete